MTAGEIAAGLAARTLDVCAHLFPAGRANGDEYEIGDVTGSAGRSLRVNLNGKAGVWCDFATGEKGDMLDLWRAARGLDTAAAMREAAEWLGLPPRRPDERQDDVPGDAPAGHPRWKGRPAGRWCYRDADGAPWLVVYRYQTRDGKAYFAYDHRAGKWIEKGGHKLPERRPLYRLDRFARRPAADIVLVEGERCADALARFGILATSTLGGCGQVKRADFGALAGWRVRIWRDADEPGRKYAIEAAAMLRDAGAAEVLIVPIPEGKGDGWDVADAVAEGWTAEEIRAQLEAAEPIETEAAAETSGRWRLLTAEEIEDQPPRPELVAGILPVGSFGALVGAPGAAKTTLLLDLALSIATGVDWHGRPVQRGTVVIVAAEGARGLGPRLLAWKRAQAWIGPTGVYVLPHAANMMQDADVTALLAAIRRLPSAPVLVALDTLARCMVGGEENSARDVGLWIAGADRIRAETGAALLAVHHTPIAGGRERGSSALRGAADTVMLLEREDQTVTLTCEKAKDAPPFEPIRLGLRVVELPDGESALALTDEPADAPRAGRLPETRRRALDALRDLDHGDGATATEWQRASGLIERTFHRAVKDLVAWGHVGRQGRGRTVRYSIRRTADD